MSLHCGNKRPPVKCFACENDCCDSEAMLAIALDADPVCTIHCFDALLVMSGSTPSANL